MRSPNGWTRIKRPLLLAIDPSTGNASIVLEVVIGGSTSQKIEFWCVTPVAQPAGADQAVVTLGNADGEIGGLAVSDPPAQAEVQALRDKAEELADDVRALSTLVHALRAALVAVGVLKRGG